MKYWRHAAAVFALALAPEGSAYAGLIGDSVLFEVLAGRTMTLSGTLRWSVGVWSSRAANGTNIGNSFVFGGNSIDLLDSSIHLSGTIQRT